MDDKSRKQHQDSPEILHTGDLVLLKCQLQVDDPYAEAGQSENDTGFVTADGIRAEVSVLPCDNIEGTGLDIREFLFVVVDQLSYIAQKDLLRRRKQIALSGDAPRGSTLARLRTYEDRAKTEEQQNVELAKSSRRPLYYGDVVQLQHVRTKRYVSVRNKVPAALQRTSRQVQLQVGSATSWLRLTPFFKHKIQGQPVALGEQVALECMKLGNGWNLNWYTSFSDALNEPMFEVNCAKPGRGFYFILYSRRVMVSNLTHSVDQTPLALGFGLDICMSLPHNTGTVCASCAPEKRTPYLRMVSNPSEQNGKNVWVIEHVSSHNYGTEHGIMWLTTPFYLRHCGSGRYLAVCMEELREKGVLDPEGQLNSAPNATTKQANKTQSASGSQVAELRSTKAELVDLPGPACIFCFEATSVLKTNEPGVKNYVPRDQNTPMMLKWENPFEHWSLWLSCNGLQKGKRRSLTLHWSETRYPRDAIKLQILSDTAWMVEADVVCEHASIMRRAITPRLVEFENPKLAFAICSRAEHMLADMIFFLSGSAEWRKGDGSKGSTDVLDPMDVPWRSKPHRQRLVRELKYIDATFDLFHEFVKLTPSLAGNEVQWGDRAAALRAGSKPGTAATISLSRQSQDSKTRCLKMLVRLWVYCFLGNRENENYIQKHGWLDVINNLNGHGLGASSVFVALVSDNAQLIRTLEKGTMMKFISFIRSLGPLDTWLFFLKALCAPQQVAMSMKQQMVLTTLVFAGARASEQESEATRRNRQELIISCRLGEPRGLPLGPPLPRQPPPPLEQCLAHTVLSGTYSDIQISWMHPDQWVVGHSVLYHGPAALGIPSLPDSLDGAGSSVDLPRKWVSLASVVWVLQPDRCCEPCTGITWADMMDKGPKSPMASGASTYRRKSQSAATDRKTSKEGDPTSPPMGSGVVEAGRDSMTPYAANKVELLKVLAKYMLAQLQLISHMVKARQMNCIMALQDEYSFTLCLSGAADERLPMSIRAGFVDIISDLWLDRHPHFQVVAPSLMRNLSDLDKVRPEESLPTFALAAEETPDQWSDEHKRTLTDDVIQFYRCQWPHKMEAVLRVVRQFLCAGAKTEQQVHSESDDNIFMNAILRLLHYLFHFGFIYSSGIVHDFMGPLLRCLDGRTDRLNPKSLTDNPIVGAYTNGQVEENIGVQRGDVPEPLRPLLQNTGAMPGDAANPNKAMTRADFPPLHDSTKRYAAGDDNTAIMNSKVQMLRVISNMTQLGMHIQISKVLHCCRNHINESYDGSSGEQAAGDLHSIIAKVRKIVDNPAIQLQSRHINRPDVMFIDLMMYDNPELFSLALQMLCRYYMQTTELMGNLDRVLILTPLQVELFNNLKQDVVALGKLIYSFENWGVDDYFSTINNNKFQQLQRICLKIRNLCHLGDGSTGPREVQDMLKESEFFSHICYVVRTNPVDFPASCQGLLAKVVALMCSAGAQFIAGNQSNQLLMFQQLNHVTKLVNTHPDSALLCAEIFKGNMELCQQVPASLITQFGNLIVRERRQNRFVPWYLTFFRTIVAVGTEPVKTNQSRVIEVVQTFTPNAMLHLLQNRESQNRIMRMMEGFRSVGQLQSPEVSRSTAGDDAELIYYIRSIELLIGLALGDGVQNLVNTPFVNSVYPGETLIQLLLQASTMPPIKLDNQFSVQRYLKTRWLQLLHLTVYAVGARLIDLELLTSRLHIDFFQLLLEWVKQVLDRKDESGAGATTDGGNPLNGSGSNPPNGSHRHGLLEEDEEEYFQMMLRCIDAFFQNGYRTIIDTGTSDELITVADGYARIFGPLLGTGTANIYGFSLRDAQLLQVTVHRIMSSTQEVQPPSRATPASPRAEAPTPGIQGAHAQWQKILEVLSRDKHIIDRMANEEQQMGEIFFHISQFTDPELPEYLKEVPQGPDQCLPEHLDFRRGQLTTEEVLRRMVKYSSDHVYDDIQGIRSVQKILRAILKVARQNEDPEILGACQKQFVQARVTELIVTILDANLADDITANSWQLISQVLEGKTASVNKVVQEAILKTCQDADNSGMWAAFTDDLNSVSSKVKIIAALKLQPNMTDAELRVMQEYEDSIQNAVKAMQAVRFLVEGHYFPMQQYLFAQVGNSRNCNVPEAAAQLLIRLSKDHSAGDLMIESEIECVATTLELLMELTQGPNIRNQDFLSTMGLIEAIYKLVGSNFDKLQKINGDVYPSQVRRLKAQTVETMLSLLEGRSDSSIHLAILQRSDAHVLRERLCFVYLYFIFGAVGVASGKIITEGHAAMPLDNSSCILLASNADPDTVYDEMISASQVAEELLEDLDDLELDELFSEGLDVLALTFQLSRHSPEFEAAVMPLSPDKETFSGRREAYLSDRDFQRERSAFHRREIYRHSFEFLSRFVKTIEVLLNGQLQQLHFQRPLTEMWYVHGAAKMHIEQSVPLSSPDVKMKAFVQMCAKTHAESKLIRLLSRFSIVPGRYSKWAQRHLWDSAHRPFQTFFKDDAALIEKLLISQLFLGLALTIHTGFFLVPIRKASDTDDGLAWNSELVDRIAETMGGLYIASTATWLFLTASVKIPLNYETAYNLKPSSSCLRLLITSLVESIKDTSFSWRLTLMIMSCVAISTKQYWLYGFLVADFFIQNPTLGNVLGGIFNKGYSLSMTFLGAVIVTYVYAAVGFHYFREEFGDYCNENIHVCAQNILYQGTRNGIIGLSSMMDEVMPGDKKWTERMLYDMSYFIVFGIMILNTIVALIVDSFSALRAETEARAHISETQSFISCLERKAIESVAQLHGVSNGWEYHESQKQNKWDYMAFIFHLREKDAQDYTGPEQAIRHMIENEDVKWLPIGRSMMLEMDEEHGAKEDILVRIERQTLNLGASLNAAKEHRQMMTAAVSSLSERIDQRMDSLGEEIRLIAASVSRPARAAMGNMGASAAGSMTPGSFAAGAMRRQSSPPRTQIS